MYYVYTYIYIYRERERERETPCFEVGVFAPLGADPRRHPVVMCLNLFQSDAIPDQRYLQNARGAEETGVAGCAGSRKGNPLSPSAARGRSGYASLERPLCPLSGSRRSSGGKISQVEKFEGFPLFGGISPTQVKNRVGSNSRNSGFLLRESGVENLAVQKCPRIMACLDLKMSFKEFRAPRVWIHFPRWRF